MKPWPALCGSLPAFSAFLKVPMKFLPGNEVRLTRQYIDWVEVVREGGNVRDIGCKPVIPRMDLLVSRTEPPVRIKRFIPFRFMERDERPV